MAAELTGIGIRIRWVPVLHAQLVDPYTRGVLELIRGWAGDKKSDIADAKPCDVYVHHCIGERVLLTSHGRFNLVRSRPHIVRKR